MYNHIHWKFYEYAGLLLRGIFFTSVKFVNLILRVVLKLFNRLHFVCLYFQNIVKLLFVIM